MATLYALSDIACTFGGPSEQLAEELVQKELARASDAKFHSVLLNVSNKLATAGTKHGGER